MRLGTSFGLLAVALSGAVLAGPCSGYGAELQPAREAMRDHLFLAAPGAAV